MTRQSAYIFFRTVLVLEIWLVLLYYIVNYYEFNEPCTGVQKVVKCQTTSKFKPLNKQTDIGVSNKSIFFLFAGKIIKLDHDFMVYNYEKIS